MAQQSQHQIHFLLDSHERDGAMFIVFDWWLFPRPALVSTELEVFFFSGYFQHQYFLWLWEDCLAAQVGQILNGLAFIPVDLIELDGNRFSLDCLGSQEAAGDGRGELAVGGLGNENLIGQGQDLEVGREIHHVSEGLPWFHECPSCVDPDADMDLIAGFLVALVVVERPLHGYRCFHRPDWLDKRGHDGIAYEP
jgi:hypothetical protein